MPRGQKTDPLTAPLKCQLRSSGLGEPPTHASSLYSKKSETSTPFLESLSSVWYVPETAPTVWSCVVWSAAAKLTTDCLACAIAAPFFAVNAAALSALLVCPQGGGGFGEG